MISIFGYFNISFSNPYLNSFKEVNENLSREDELVVTSNIYNTRMRMYDIGLKIPEFAGMAYSALEDLTRNESKSYLRDEDVSQFRTDIKKTIRYENEKFFKKRNKYHHEQYIKKIIDNFAFTAILDSEYGNSILNQMRISGLDKKYADELEECLNQKIKYVNKLVLAYEPVVKEIANIYKGQGVDIEDLISEGNLACMRSAWKFDPHTGNRFITFVPYEIRTYMSITVDKNRFIRLKGTIREYVKKVHRYNAALIDKGEEALEYEKIIEILKIPKRYYHDIVNNLRDALYLEDLIKEADLTWEDLIKDTKYHSQLYLTMFKDLWEKTYKNLLALPPMLRNVLRFRFGIPNKESDSKKEIEEYFIEYDEDWKQEDICRIYNLTKQRISQIEKMAIKMLRTPKFIKEIFKKSDS
jgi:RNA polymerase primary sigma factor